MQSDWLLKNFQPIRLLKRNVFVNFLFTFSCIIKRLKNSILEYYTKEDFELLPKISTDFGTMTIHLLVCFVKGTGMLPWSSGYGRRLMFQRSWVQIPVPYTGWTVFSHLFVVKNVLFVRRDENKRKRGRG